MIIMAATSSISHGALETAVISGRVIADRPNGTMRREITLRLLDEREDSIDDAILVDLDAEASPGTSIWMGIKRLRQLICPGVRLRIEAIRLSKEDERKSNSTVLLATRIQLVSVLPTAPYLAQLLSFPVEVLQQIFSRRFEEVENNPSLKTQLPQGLVSALAPCSADECQQLILYCQTERAEGKAVTLFKQPKLRQLSRRLQVHQNGGKAPLKPPSAPRTSRDVWGALVRFETRWCRKSDGEPNEYFFHPRTSSYTTGSDTRTTEGATDVSCHKGDSLIYGDVNVDPSKNLPDPNDERRQRYVDERKRPQVQSMLALIRSVLPPRCSDASLHVVEIGGGRGYLAMAVAACFDLEYSNVHVTVVDNNESSLASGRHLAEAVNLANNMSFVLCNVSDASQMESLRQHRLSCPFDVVVGLHCCGGLAEAAIELAIESEASFCVSTCCFRSNLELASLTRLAEEMVQTNDSLLPSQIPVLPDSQAQGDDDRAAKHRDDSTLVSRLAVRVGGKGQHRAARAYNAMRLVAAEKRFERLRTRRRLQTWQETFPVEISVQNRVLMGCYDDM